MESREIYDAFIAKKCAGCGWTKRPHNAFCPWCYRELPAALKNSLWKRFGSGFEEAYQACLSWFRIHPLRMITDKYILLDDGTIQQEPDCLKWSQWFEDADRHVALDQLSDGVRVSTVFLGLDHNFAGEGPPLLFETMIFGGEHADYQDRYSTKEEALAGHARALAMAKGEMSA